MKYSKGVRFKTLNVVDRVVIDYAEKHIRSEYSIGKNNCADFVADVSNIYGIRLVKFKEGVIIPRDILKIDKTSYTDPVKLIKEAESLDYGLKIDFNSFRSDSIEEVNTTNE